MAGTKLASLPTSRVKPRPATRTSNTDELTIASAAPASIFPENPDRTVLTIFNRGSNEIRYQYRNAATILATGFPLLPGASVDLESPEEIFMQAVGADSTLGYDEGNG